MASGGFDNTWLKVGRARQHIDDLEAEIIAFHKANPYLIITRDDPQTGKRTAMIGKEPAPIPDAIPLILGDTVHAIRVSLDYFACAAVPNPGDHTAFPVFRQSSIPTTKQSKDLVNERMKGASKQLTRTLYDLEPYKGGRGQAVWIVNYLDRIDKHRLLVTIGIAYSSLTFDGTVELRELADWTKDLPAMPISLRPAERYPVKNGTALFIADSDYFDKHKKDLKFTFDVAFGEPQILVSEPVVPMLRQLLSEVESLLKHLIPLA